MSNPDTPWRDGRAGKASPAQYRAARRWAARFGRWAAVGTDERLEDFARAEAADEAERWKRS